jgi:hypothetical protein
LDAAQAQLDAAAASPAFAVILPLGPAQQADIEYQIHAAHAACSGDATTRQSELDAARTAAQRGVGLHRDALDYPGMAVMQFNVADTERQLGNREGAIAALQAAIEMDKEFALAEDGQDNARRLASWTGRDVESSTTAPPPAPPVTLKFAWHESDATVRLTVTTTTLVDHRIVHVTAARSVTRHIRPLNGGWLVSHEPAGLIEATATGLRKEDLGSLVTPVSEALLMLPDIEVSAHGELRTIRSLKAFSAQMQQAVAKLTLEHSGPWQHLLSANFGLLSEDGLAAQIQENHSFETAAWIGATLEQGLWYDTTAHLMSPVIGAAGRPQHVRFAYTRDVACVEGAAQRGCMELVAHAADFIPTANKSIFGERTRLSVPEYWSATDIRIVLDRQTLLPYLRDERRYWWSPAQKMTRQQRDIWQTGAQRIVAAFTYVPGVSPPASGPLSAR